jgi:hypothetical protein
MNNWQMEFDWEIDRARSARARGNEGQARVCARRAAGIAVREYCSRSGISITSASALDLLRQIASSADLNPAARTIAAHLLLRVDEEFKLPPEIDLIEEAIKLRDEMRG